MKNIIIADDHPHFINGLQVLIDNLADYQVIGTAKDGDEAVNHARLREAHLVLLDINMPNLDGITAGKI